MVGNEAFDAGMKNDIIQTFGQVAQPVKNEHPPKRDNVMTFSRGSFRVSLDMNSFWDRIAEQYGDFTAGISLSNNKRYSSIPTDPKIILELSDWLKKIAEVVREAPTRDADRTDNNIDEAKKIVAKYKKV